MKVLIIGLGIIVGSMGVLMGYVSIDRENKKAGDAQRLESEILGLKQKVLLLRDLPQRAAVPLDETYVIFMNDMHLIAKAHRVAFAASFQGGSDVSIGKNAGPSVFSGLREARFHGVFSGLTRRVALLSLLDALSAFEKGTPVLFQSIGHEKDTLVFDIKVVGL